MQRMIINLLTFYCDRKTLFDNWQVPRQIVKQDLVDRLLMECGELELYITNPNALEYLIGSWSRGKLPDWQKVADILDVEYNPIWNVDGVVTHTERTSGSQDTEATHNRKETGNISATGKETSEESTRSADTKTTGETWTESEESETVNRLSADNVEGWSNDTKTDLKSGKDGERNIAENGSGTIQKNGEINRTDNTDTETNETVGDTENVSHITENTWEDKRTGNIGVTTTQKMMTEEKDFWQNFDLYGYLVNEFRKEFLLLVY